MLDAADEIIDIGADHAILCAHAVLCGKAGHATAADISAASLEKAHAFDDTAALEGKISLVVSDGFDRVPLPQSSFNVVIAGMGGELIAKILAAGIDKAKQAKGIAMQPMGGARELRAYLYANGFCIDNERIIKEGGRYYQIITAHYDGDIRPMPSNALLEFGVVVFSKRETELKGLLERVCAVRKRKLIRARENGSEPKELIEELNEAQALLERW